MTYEEAEEAMRLANTELHLVNMLVSNMKSEIRDKYKKLEDKEIQEVNERHADELAMRSKIACEATAKFNEFKVAKASQEGWGDFPVGTELCMWAASGSYGRGKLVIKKRGVVEVCTKDTKLAENLGWKKPDIGEAFVRVLKKDGTPSLMAGEKWGTWLPEGQKPEGAE